MRKQHVHRLNLPTNLINAFAFDPYCSTTKQPDGLRRYSSVNDVVWRRQESETHGHFERRRNGSDPAAAATCQDASDAAAIHGSAGRWISRLQLSTWNDATLNGNDR